MASRALAIVSSSGYQEGKEWGAGNPCDALLELPSCIPCVVSPVPRELQGQLSLPSGFLFAPQNLFTAEGQENVLQTSCLRVRGLMQRSSWTSAVRLGRTLVVPSGTSVTVC